MERLTPKDRGEEVALFRAEVIGSLARREMSRGELAAALREIAAQRFRPPGAAATRRFAVPTLQRWYYALRRGGLAALGPRARTDRGRGRVLAPAERDLLLDIRREHPRASVPLILRTLVADGRLAPRSVSAPTVRRLYREHGLDRRARRDAAQRVRLRWQAERPGALWHGDVCHAVLRRSPGLTHCCSSKMVRVEISDRRSLDVPPDGRACGSSVRCHAGRRCRWPSARQRVALAAAQGTIRRDRRRERLCPRDDVIRRRGRVCQVRIAEVDGGPERGLRGDQRDKREVDGCVERAEDRQLGRAPELVGRRQAPAPPGTAPRGHPCGSRSDGPSMRTVWH
jgi:hypothetical protein